MQREIKFRGKRLDNKKWIYGDLIENQGRFFIYHASNENTIEDNDDGRIVVVAVEVDPTTVGQYTGLKDRDGREIYEGDIFLPGYFGGTNVVIWDDGNVRYIGRSPHGLISYVGREPAVEVLGNIHDNLELLNEGEQ